jgi:hypothetical protein
MKHNFVAKNAWRVNKGGKHDKREKRNAWKQVYKRENESNRSSLA